MITLILFYASSIDQLKERRLLKIIIYLQTIISSEFLCYSLYFSSRMQDANKISSTSISFKTSIATNIDPYESFGHLSIVSTNESRP